MDQRRFKVGDIVEVTRYTPARYAPGVKDELGTEALFRRLVGRRYRIMGFDGYGHIELHPTRRDWVWIKPGDVRLAPRKKTRKRNGRKGARAAYAIPIHAYTTKELSKETWPDFVRLFSQGNGWDFCWCMHFQRPCSLPRNQWFRTRAERGVRNRREKRALVERRRAHGILVYAGGVPVGWCQYGLRDELPRIDNSRKYQGLSPEGSQRLWRITCFVVDKTYRRRGVASTALKAALHAIRRKGGGLVEAYPITRWLPRAFGNESTHGTASMFAKAGFKVVAPFGSTRFSTHALLRRTV